MTVVSLYDYTGIAVRPWAEAGNACYCYDIQHRAVMPRVVRFEGGGSITYLRADLHDQSVLSDIVKAHIGMSEFMFGFPVCTDLAVSGAAHFAGKRQVDPLFQERAAGHAIWAAKVGDALGCPYMIENPISVLSTMWRKPDHSFDPWEYGGYLRDDEAEHPQWPQYIAARDAYPKKTCLWTGGGFVMPEKRPVPFGGGYSTQHKKLGGKSDRTKNIRSATPRGFVRAVFEANKEIPE